MKKISILLLSIAIGIILNACSKDDSKMDSNIVSTGTNSSSQAIEESQNLDKKSYAGLEDVFQDTSVITPNGKYLMMVFSANGCPYCEKLKQDIKDHQDERDYIKKNFSAYYINMSYNKTHDFKIGTKDNPIDKKFSTSELASLYKVNPTPTIVFSDNTGKTIFVFPGYMPYKRFMAMLEFVGNGVWKQAKDPKDMDKLLSEYVLSNS